MPATVTSLDRAIADEERCVGIATDRPLTARTIVHRRTQIAVLFVACGLAALWAAFASTVSVQVVAVVLAGAFGLYAIRQDRHLRRLALLRGDSKRITLCVADELLFAGAITDTELLELRASVGRAAGSLAAGLSDVLPSECARVRLVGPSGEVPTAAVRVIAPRAPLEDDRSVALNALRHSASMRSAVGERMAIVVPMWRGDDAIGLLEVVSAPGERYRPVDTALVDAYAQGAVAALRTSH
jgi:hypothetical protein